jgi:hypothetical protein
MSDAPKMHKAKDVWKDMVATRPVDPHPHVSIFPVCSSYLQKRVSPPQSMDCQTFLNVIHGENRDGSKP